VECSGEKKLHKKLVGHIQKGSLMWNLVHVDLKHTLFLSTNII